MTDTPIQLQGIPSAPGTGAGMVFVLQEKFLPKQAFIPSRSPEEELKRYQRGTEIVSEFYGGMIDKITSDMGSSEAEIFEGHKELVEGDDLLEGVTELLQNSRTTAEGAVLEFCAQTSKEFAEMESEYFQQRSGDFLDIGKLLSQAIFYGTIPESTQLPDQCIILARELTPSMAVNLDLKKTEGIATELGGPASHAAILARSLSIPCVTGVTGLLEQIDFTGSGYAAVDGTSGKVQIGIPMAEVTEYQRLTTARRVQENQLQQWSKTFQAKLENGDPVELAANISSIDDAHSASDGGALGSGLVRSEFLFMKYPNYPSVDQQILQYRSICEVLAPHRVTIRLLDCGADKPLPYDPQDTEENPFLGVRGIRFLATRPAVLTNQIRAIAQVHAEGHAIRLMIPMVISPKEITMVREIAGSINPALPIGIMVETPASVFGIEQLLPHTDFVSIGTNDLTQYILAVDRGNGNASHLYQELHPAVLSAIKSTIKSCAAANIPLGICGDMASKIEGAAVLLALGIRKLSATPSTIPRLKKAIMSMDDHFLRSLNLLIDGNTNPDELIAFIQNTLSPSVKSEGK